MQVQGNIFKQFLAYLYLENSDQAKYGSILSGLISQQSLKNDQYNSFSYCIFFSSTTNVVNINTKHYCSILVAPLHQTVIDKTFLKSDKFQWTNTMLVQLVPTHKSICWVINILHLGPFLWINLGPLGLSCRSLL